MCGLEPWDIEASNDLQRLTTLQILLGSVRSQLEARGLVMLAAQIEPLIVNPIAFRKTDPVQSRSGW